MAKAKSGAKPKASRKSKRKGDSGEKHVRIKASPRLVKSIIDQVLATKHRTSAAGQQLQTAIRNGTDAGVNIPALRIAARVYSAAKQDPIKARVLFEDINYYLTECTDFTKIAPEGMFTAEESGQKRSKKKQMMMPVIDEIESAPEEPSAPAPSQVMPGDVGPMLQ